MSYQSNENEFLKALGVSADGLRKESSNPTLCKKKKKTTACDEYIKLCRRIRIELLSRPICRKLRPWPNPKLEGPFVISRAALKAKLTDRLEYLAIPKIENDSWRSYYSPTRPPGNKIKIITDRLIELSRPRPFIDDIDEKIVSTRFKSKIEWLTYLKKLKIFGAPRRAPPSPLGPKRMKKPLKAIMTHLEPLSRPVNRPPDMNEKTFEELFTIKRATLKHNASDRTKNLAVAKQLNESALMDINYDPRDKLIYAKKYIATDRIKELSTPKIRETPKTFDVKANAFTVNPNALKAWCSPRIKRLAKPIMRD